MRLAVCVPRNDEQIGLSLARGRAAQPLALQRAVGGVRGRRVDDGRSVAVPGQG